MGAVVRYRKAHHYHLSPSDGPRKWANLNTKHRNRCPRLARVQWSGSPMKEWRRTLLDFQGLSSGAAGPQSARVAVSVHFERYASPIPECLSAKHLSSVFRDIRWDRFEGKRRLTMATLPILAGVRRSECRRVRTPRRAGAGCGPKSDGTNPAVRDRHIHRYLRIHTHRTSPPSFFF